jgi:prepilin-type N-terminal cleavage/methylation domain-containing protein
LNLGCGNGIGFGIEWVSSRGKPQTAARRGTSLVELLVVLALLSVMVLVAAQLVVHSMRLLDATARAVRNPLVVHVCSRLRHDVQEAAALQWEEWSWTDDPLVLIHPDGSRVRFELEGENLVRERTGVVGEASDQSVILRGVTSWWWRCPTAGVVDLNITYLVNPAPERHVSRDPGYGLERSKENLRFALRGGGDGTRW